MRILLYIAVGGAAGAIARYGLAGWVHSRAGFQFPWGTLVVNVLGSFLIGVALRWLDASTATPAVRAAITIGLLGSFTTFSTFSYEAVTLLQDAEWQKAAGYVLGSVLLGIAAVYAGMAITGIAINDARAP